MDPESGKEALDNRHRFLFFLFPLGNDPIAALETIERVELGNIPPALAAAILAAHHAFQNGHIVSQWAPSAFATVAGRSAAQGISISRLSPKSDHGHQVPALVDRFFQGQTEFLPNMEEVLPSAPVDRAKALLTLGKALWEPDSRLKFSKTPYPSDDPLNDLNFIAKAWQQLQAEACIEVAGERIRFNKMRFMFITWIIGIRHSNGICIRSPARRFISSALRPAGCSIEMILL